MLFLYPMKLPYDLRCSHFTVRRQVVKFMDEIKSIFEQIYDVLYCVFQKMLKKIPFSLQFSHISACDPLANLCRFQLICLNKWSKISWNISANHYNSFEVQIIVKLRVTIWDTQEWHCKTKYVEQLKVIISLRCNGTFSTNYNEIQHFGCWHSL